MIRNLFRKRKKPNLQPEYMIVGLGNPGPEYRGTRHNLGFDVVDRVKSEYKLKLNTSRDQALYEAFEMSGRSVVLVKPLTFMNRSGRAVSAISKRFGIKPENILVITDDLDLPVGVAKMKPKGGAGGHNGHKSIIGSLGTTDYPRVKIGIGKGDESTVDHVLSRVDPQEREHLDRAVEKVWKTCEVFVADGVEAAMTYCNSD